MPLAVQQTYPIGYFRFFGPIFYYWQSLVYFKITVNTPLECFELKIV